MTSGDLLLTQEGYTIQAALHETSRNTECEIVYLVVFANCDSALPGQCHANWSKKLVAYRETQVGRLQAALVDS